MPKTSCGQCSLHFYRATMTHDRFKHLMRVIRCHGKTSMQERRKSDSFAAIREVFKQNDLLLDHFRVLGVAMDETPVPPLRDLHPRQASQIRQLGRRNGELHAQDASKRSQNERTGPSARRRRLQHRKHLWLVVPLH